MNTWLYLTPEGCAEASNEWPCCVWSGAGQRQLLPLNQVAQTLQGQTIMVMLPMELCSWVRTDPWPSRRRPSTPTLVFSVEDQLSEPLEQLHLSAGPRDRDGRYPLMAINRDRFARVLALLAESGIEARSVFVDADLLPADQPRGVWWFGRWLLGGALNVRMALSKADLQLLGPALSNDALWLDERQGTDAFEQWMTARNTQAIDLMQGDFAARRKRLPWRPACLALLTLLLMTWAAGETRIRFLASETQHLAGRNEDRFKALYPDQQRIVDVATQLKMLQSPRIEPQNTRISGLVKLVEQVVGASHVEVRRIEYRVGGGWKILLTANSFAELEQLRERGRQQGMPISLDSASKQSDRVQATLSVEDEA
ncbi:type II secretion system protein GspL [Pseudomonas sp. PB3P13]